MRKKKQNSKFNRLDRFYFRHFISLIFIYSLSIQCNDLIKKSFKENNVYSRVTGATCGRGTVYYSGIPESLAVLVLFDCFVLCICLVNILFVFPLFTVSDYLLCIVKLVLFLVLGALFSKQKSHWEIASDM